MSRAPPGEPRTKGGRLCHEQLPAGHASPGGPPSDPGDGLERSLGKRRPRVAMPYVRAHSLRRRTAGRMPVLLFPENGVQKGLARGLIQLRSASDCKISSLNVELRHNAQSSPARSFLVRPLECFVGDVGAQVGQPFQCGEDLARLFVLGCIDDLLLLIQVLQPFLGE